jgi:hypothetical protein
MQCILCGDAPLTKAHIIPRALHRLIRTEMGPADTAFVVGARSSGATSSYEFRDSGRDALTYQPRVLCAYCNNVWMEQLEGRAVPIARQLIVGDRISVSKESMTDLASWAVAMAVILGETHHDDCHFTPSDVKAFRETSRPGEEMLVALAWTYPQLVTWSVGAIHNPVWPLSNFQHSANPVDQPGEIVAIWLGRLCVLVANRTGVSVLAHRLGSLAKHVPVIWPPADEPLNWPPLAELPMQSLGTALNRGRGPDAYLTEGLTMRDRRR